MAAIRHIVPVSLNYNEGDPRIQEFFDAAKELLSSIPCVHEYHHYKQIQADTQFQYGFVLEFKSEEDFQEFMSDPNEEEFTLKYWNMAVKGFMDCNFVAFE